MPMPAILSCTVSAVATIILGLLLYPVLLYLWDPYCLRQFPSPSFSALSPLWRIWQNIQMRHYLAVDDAHRKLGTHVRIAPNHVSILHPSAPAEIYGHGAGMLKDAWYDAGAGFHRNIADTRNKAEHRAKRKALAHAFAAKTVISLEPRLSRTLETLMNKLDSHENQNQEVNMRRLLNYFTIDLFGLLLYSRSLGCIERGDDILDAERPNVLAFVPFISSYIKPIVGLHPWKQAGVDWENIIVHNTKQRLNKSANLEQPDLFSQLEFNSRGEPQNLSLGEMVAECSAMMNAGTETTTAAMTNTVYLLYTHPTVLIKLRAELDTAFPGCQMPTYETSARLPYLRACIEESLRVRPASSFGLPRIIPEDGRVISGKYIPGGVVVSVPTYSLLRDESIFDRANEYIPDRWMTQDADLKARMANNHLPFSTGPRSCIGRNIAYFEQIVVIAALVKCYDLVVPAGLKLATEERFNSNAGDLFINVRRRKL